MSATTETRIVPEPEDPGLVAANLSVGARLFASAVTFVFVAFVFAFFYLKTVNSNGDWRPAQIKPAQGGGIAVLAGALLTTLLFELARRQLRRPGAGRWRPLVTLALVLAVAVLVLELLQLTGTSFHIYDGGYASVFYGWTALFVLFWLGAVYGIETTLAWSIRGAVSSELATGEPLELISPSAAAWAVYLYVLSAIGIVGYVLLYLIK